MPGGSRGGYVGAASPLCRQLAVRRRAVLCLAAQSRGEDRVAYRGERVKLIGLAKSLAPLPCKRSHYSA